MPLMISAGNKTLKKKKKRNNNLGIINCLPLLLIRVLSYLKFLGQAFLLFIWFRLSFSAYQYAFFNMKAF